MSSCTTSRQSRIKWFHFADARASARECLLAAKEASQPYYRKLLPSMASSWLSLARQEEAMDKLVGWALAESVTIDRLPD
jgi:hypothetical protein